MQWETVIGLEVHAQLSTHSKIFSGASTAYGAEPNVQACAVDIALPGVLPVLNKAAVEKAIIFGLAVDAKINHHSVFARKNYFYPDLPKGYQISQYEIPIVQGGTISIRFKEGEKNVRLTRAHLEEDAGKSLHENFRDSTGIDLNRAGTPLLEIVSEPDMRSAAEAVAYAKTLHSLVRWIDICDGNMQEGSFRFDANVSVRRKGSDKLSTRCEIKNLNSFRFLEHAIEFEARRQSGILEDGGVIEQETRQYDPEKDETRSMRTKEEAHDYRYFPDPDLVPLKLDKEWIEGCRKQITELPAARLKRFVGEFALSEYDAGVLTASKAVADYFESCVKLFNQPKTVSNWVMGELTRELNNSGTDASASAVSPERLVSLLQLVDQGTISLKVAREIFPEVYSSGKTPEQIVKEKGLTQVSDEGALDKIIHEVLAKNPTQVAQFKEGKQQVLGFLVGQVMKASGGKANPGKVNELLKKRLAG